MVHHQTERSRKESRNTAESVVELDDLLEEGSLRVIKVQFWKRYKMMYPVEVSPSDQLLSRCYREMDMRRLTVYDIWKVKTLQQQIMAKNEEGGQYRSTHATEMERHGATKKRKGGGTDLHTGKDEQELSSEGHGVERYLAALQTYLLALSIAGSSKVQGAPQEEAFGNDATKFVKVPWDVLQSYASRASRTVMLVPEASRLAWLEERDITERAAWVSQFREGNAPLGQVVQSIMEERRAHWDTPIRSTVKHPRPIGAPVKAAQPKGSPRKRRHMQPKGKDKETPQGPRVPFVPRGPQPPHIHPTTPGMTRDTLRDGTTLCPDFNRGKCLTRGASCPKGVHKCSKVRRGGRSCGMPFHGAHICRNA